MSPNNQSFEEPDCAEVIPPQPKRFDRPMATLLSMVLGGLVVVAVLPVVLLGFIGAKDNTSRLLRDLQEQTLQGVVDHIRGTLDPAQTIAEFIQAAVRRGDIDPGAPNEAAFRNFIISSMSASPQVTGIGYVSLDRDVVIYNRALRASYPANETLIPQVDTILNAVQIQDTPQWLDITWSRIIRAPILRLVAPLYVPEGGFAGAIVLAVEISEFSRFLAEYPLPFSTTNVFVLAGDNRVIAHPRLIESFADASMENPLPTLDGLGDEVLAAIWEPPHNPLTALAELRTLDGHWKWLNDNGGYVYFYRGLTGYGPEGWIVGTYGPVEESRRSRWTVNAIGIGGGIMLLLSMYAALRLGRRYAKPVLALAEAAKRIEAYDFDSVKNIKRGPIREVNQAADAFERTAIGLKLFEAYVPRPIARHLMECGEISEPQQGVGTVLFVDLAQFTTIAEAIPANEVVEMLNEYFDTVAKIIAEHNGVITQFQGDAVLATFNMPVQEPEHATCALVAARAIRDAVTERTFGGQELSVRIGVNTGSMVGGSVGAEGRRNYTVHGDTVNLAARLEALNKEHGTTILTTQETIIAAGDPEDAIEVGILRVRGRINQTKLYAIGAPNPAGASTKE